MKKIICNILTLLLIINLIPNMSWAARDDDYDNDLEEPRLYVTSKNLYW